MGTLGRTTRNGTKPAARRVEPRERAHPAIAKLAVALKENKETLEQQAATADILRALSRSSSDPQPVFEAIVEHAHRLCGAVFSILYRYDGNVMTVAADRVNAKASRILRTLYPAPPRRDHIVGRAILEGRVMHSSDVPNDPRFPANRNAFMKVVPFRAGLEVPLLRNGVVVGLIAVGRLEPKAFTKKEIGLLKTFAEQAVIAIEKVRLFNETKEALEHQKASADILRIVAGSVENTDPVFEAITSAGMRLFPGIRVSLSLAREGQVHYVSHSGVSKERRAQVAKLFPVPLDRNTVVAASILDARMVHIPDIAAVGNKFPVSAKTSHVSGWVAMLAVPLIEDGKALGCLGMSRGTAGPFSDKQIALAQTFADQAVIAIRNARLFNETREALERQTATAEILKVISSSPTDVQPVFDAIAKSAKRLLGGFSAAVTRRAGDALHLVAFTTASESGDKTLKSYFPVPLSDGHRQHVKAVLTKGPVYLSDTEGPGISSTARALARARGYRSSLNVPMIRDGEAIGTIAVSRREPGLFSNHQIELLKTFADQAVIAIENVRLFNETKEALEHQKASADILRIVAGSVEDTDPVFEAITAAGMRLVPGARVALTLVRDGQVHYVSHSGVSAERRAEVAKHFPIPLEGSPSVATTAILEKRVIHLPDIEAAGNELELGKQVARVSGYRAMLTVPLLREGHAIGTIAVTREQPGAFTDKQIELAKTFADQAVIAIQNAQMFREIQDRNAELKQALDFQGASGEILASISSSMTNTQPVFDAIVESTRRLFNTRYAVVSLIRENRLELVAASGDETYLKHVREAYPWPLAGEDGMVAARAFGNGQVVQVCPILGNPDAPARMQRLARASGYNATLLAPMMREGVAIGLVVTARSQADRFDEKQVALIKVFADQAVIAIQNAKMFREIQERNAELKQALDFQGASGEILASISSSVTDTKPVFDAIAENTRRLLDTSYAAVSLVREDRLELAAAAGDEKYLRPLRAEYPWQLDGDDGLFARRAVRDGKVVHVCPVLGDAEAPPKTKRLAQAAGYDSLLIVPMLREGVAIGVIIAARRQAVPFDDKQIALIRAFADQAVIAIENVRLFNETKEALERQTATAEILKVIASSRIEVQPVFDAIVHSAARLFGRKAALRLVEPDGLRRRARSYADTGEFHGADLLPVDRDSLVGRAVLEGKAMQVLDTYGPDTPPYAQLRSRELNYRSIASAPLLRDGAAIGVISVSSENPGGLSDKQMALLATFADQAVIAIENVRLFNETKESLEQQTASAEILRVISSTPTDIQPVFDAIAKSAMRIFEGMEVAVALVEGSDFEIKATSVDHARLGVGLRVPLDRSSAGGRSILDGVVVNIADTESPETPPVTRQRARDIGFRAFAAAPMLREGTAIGHIAVMRQLPVALSDKQIALLRTFADQAVIAIENVRLFNETKEALEQQTASSEVLEVISKSPSDLGPVFEAILESATRLCDAHLALLNLYDGEHYRTVAHRSANSEFSKWVMDRGAYKPDPQSALARIAYEWEPIQVLDMRESPAFRAGDVHVVKFVELGGARTYLVVPLLKDGGVLGVIAIYRQEVRAFSGKQIELVKTFARQAVIAIENVRLFNETKEALEQQTATSEILKVISSSTTDTQPVFEAIVQSAAQLFEPCNAVINIREGDRLRRKARAGPRNTVDLDELNRSHPVLLSGSAASARAVRERRIVEVLDTQALDASEMARSTGRLANYRSAVVVPLMKEEEAIGVLALTHEEPGYKLQSKQLGLLRTFADQAVIAIENVRLFKELQERNRALTEALEQQTATGEILKTISSATSDVQPVFDTIVRNAVRLCDAAYGMLLIYDGKMMDIGAQSIYGPESDLLGMLRRQYPMPASRETPSAHAIFERTTINIADIHETSYSHAVKERARAQGWRSGLTLPMMRDDTPIGALSVVRREPGVFSDSYVALLKTFAAQAVIAVENVRLFNEINEALRLQTSTADVLKTISRSTFDLDKVLQALLDNATRLSGAERAMMLRPDAAGNYLPTVTFGFEPDSPLLARVRERPIRPGRESINGRVLLEKRPIHVPDVLADPEYGRQDLVEVGIYRTVLSVPMLRDGEAIGLISLNKGPDVDPFTDKQMELVTTFADQAVIAIENVRLFKEIEEKSAQLEVANKHKSDFLANMSHELRTPLNAVIGFSEALMDRMFGELNDKQADYLKDIHESGKHLLSLINDILDLSKIEAGRMELDLSTFHLPTAISNAMTLIRERAQRHGVALALDVDSRLGDVAADERKVKQIMLNLLSNAVKFTPEGGRVEVIAKLDTDHVEIAVKDSGIGIAPEDLSSLFEEFRQVGKDSSRKAEGTGLGLALTKRFVELHGGAIRVESAQGKGSIFTFSLPVRQ